MFWLEHPERELRERGNSPVKAQISDQTSQYLRELETLLPDHTWQQRLDLYNHEAKELAKRDFDDGYKLRIDTLNRSLQNYSYINPEIQRQLVHEIAITQSKLIKAQEHNPDYTFDVREATNPDFIRGERAAIRDWSHKHNHQEIQRQLNSSAEIKQAQYTQGYKAKIDFLNDDLRFLTGTDQNPTHRRDVINQIYQHHSASRPDWYEHPEHSRGQREAIADLTAKQISVLQNQAQTITNPANHHSQELTREQSAAKKELVCCPENKWTGYFWFSLERGAER